MVKDAFSSVPHLANPHNSNLFCVNYFIRKSDLPQMGEWIFAQNANVNIKPLMVKSLSIFLGENVISLWKIWNLVYIFSKTVILKSH